MFLGIINFSSNGRKINDTELYNTGVYTFERKMIILFLHRMKIYLHYISVLEEKQRFQLFCKKYTKTNEYRCRANYLHITH